MNFVFGKHALNHGILIGQNITILNPACTSVDIPVSMLRLCPTEMVADLNNICFKTNTYIIFEHYHDTVTYTIFGKWRNCYAASRQLWYNLIRDHHYYINGAWNRHLNTPLTDNNHTRKKSIRTLYSRLKFENLKEFQCLVVRGSYWDILKFGKEMLKRTGQDTHHLQRRYANPFKSSTNDTAATDVLAMMRSDMQKCSPTPFEPCTASMSDIEQLNMILGPKPKYDKSTTLYQQFQQIQQKSMNSSTVDLMKKRTNIVVKDNFPVWFASVDDHYLSSVKLEPIDF